MSAPVLGKVDGRQAVTRVAATGAPVELTLPAAFGEHRWYGNTRFTGPRLARQFFLAPAGEHRVIPSTILPGARETRRSVRGHDVVLFEAPDRSDAALVFAGPYHEATTWFGGPAPDPAGLARLVSTFRFADSAAGATLVPASGAAVSQPDTTLIGRSPDSMVLVRRSVEALPTLPDWAGMSLPGGELWRTDRGLDDAGTAAVKGTPHQWRYLFAGPTAAMDVVLFGPESGRVATALDDADVLAALGLLSAHWAG